MVTMGKDLLCSIAVLFPAAAPEARLDFFVGVDCPGSVPFLLLLDPNGGELAPPVPIAPSVSLDTVQTSTPAPPAFLPRLVATASVGEPSRSQR